MPHSELQWNSIRNEGNPTKSKLMKVLLKKVTKAETREQGRPSQERRALTEGMNGYHFMYHLNE